FGLVLQLATQLSPAAVRDGFGQPPVADHVLDREVFDRDQAVAADQVRGYAVQEVGTGVADLAVRAGDFGFGLTSVHAATLAAGHAPLVAGQVTGLALQMARVRDSLPVAGHGEVGDPEVHADLTPCLGQRGRLVGVDRDGHVPADVRFPADHHHSRVPRGQVHVVERPHHRQR